MNKIHKLIAFTVVVFSLSTSIQGSETTSNERTLTSTTEDLRIPAKLAADIDPGQYSFRPLSQARYRQHRDWFLYKLGRLKSYIQSSKKQDWEDKYCPSYLTQELGSSFPDVHELRTRYTNSYATFVEDDRVDDLAGERFHSVRTTARAFQRYLVTLEDQRDPEKATTRLRQELYALKLRLEAYSQGMGIGQVTDFCVEIAELDQMRAIHNIVQRIEISEQAPELIEKLRSHYMQPKARLHLSTKLLSKTIDVELPNTSVVRVQDGAKIHGSSTPNSRLFVFSKPNNERAELGVAYNGTMTFCGTLDITSPIKRTTGLQMELCQSTHKTLLLEANAPDSNRTFSASSLLHAKTQRGKIFDCLVTPSLRRGVPKDPINDKIRNGIDTAVTGLANFIPSQANSLLDAFAGDVYYPVSGIIRRRETPSRSLSIALKADSCQSRSACLQ